MPDVRRSFGREQCAKYMRLQCLNGYGLAVLAHDLLPEEDFQRVRLPEGPSFSPAYLQWRLALPELPKRLYFTSSRPIQKMMEVRLAVQAHCLIAEGGRLPQCIEADAAGLPYGYRREWAEYLGVKGGNSTLYICFYFPELKMANLTNCNAMSYTR